MLIVADQHFHWLDKSKSLVAIVATPFYKVADIPARLSDWQQDTLVSRRKLLEENARLRSEALVLKGKLQKLAALSAENVRLRELLNSRELLQDSVLIGELIGVSPNPLRHEVIVNKGTEEEAYVGQPVIDAQGLLGQVVSVSRYHSRVLLLTDSTHAVPVQVNRNGVRAVAEGTGRIDQLELPHVAATTDIREGDLLVTSGLGGRFPVGYPVAVVSEVIEDPGQPFVEVHAQPAALVDRSRHVLLVFTEEEALPAAVEQLQQEQ